MPCYDKKLEGSRPDFVHNHDTGERDVDCVLTTTELIELLAEHGINADTCASSGAFREQDEQENAGLDMPFNCVDEDAALHVTATRR